MGSEPRGRATSSAPESEPRVSAVLVVGGKRARGSGVELCASRVDPVMDEGKYIHRRNSRAGSRSLWTHMTCSTTIQTCTAVRQDGPRYPLEVLTIFDIMLMDLVALIELLFKKHIPTRICNLKSLISLRNLNPSVSPAKQRAPCHQLRAAVNRHNPDLVPF